MSTIKNHVQLIGNVGQEPTITTLDSGNKVARLSLATNENYKNGKGEKQTGINWHTVIAWDKTADIIEKYVTKGKEIALEGKLTTRSYEDKERNKRYVTEVVVNEILLMGSKERRHHPQKFYPLFIINLNQKNNERQRIDNHIKR